ncbi:uncharacterized protein LOC100198647 isoform X14 [Hydra vulgaris]|uniref:Uncharacterized protein LOC100198647 isoform X14 n=2 Tax=Hydra vulgaris TaxID=6087 RepID=A0ABM4B680_HYDVU
MKLICTLTLLFLSSELLAYDGRFKHLPDLKKREKVSSQKSLHRKDVIEKPSNRSVQANTTTDMEVLAPPLSLLVEKHVNASTIPEKRSHFLLRNRYNEEDIKLKNETEPIELPAKEDIQKSVIEAKSISHTNTSTMIGDKKGVDSAVKRDSNKKGMSAIVVIGNRTHRVSGPVVKQLLSELQRQNTDEENKKISNRGGKEIGQAGDSNGSLKRLHAANEVAEINKLLGKPLTDDRALGLIKNLLLDKVHSHLAKTMDLNDIKDVAELADQQSPASVSSDSSATAGPVKAPSQENVCRDLDPKEKCLYLKEMGLCSEASSNPHIRRRCQETCQLCEQCHCADSQGICSPCQTLPLPVAPPPSVVVAVPPPPPAQIAIVAPPPALPLQPAPFAVVPTHPPSLCPVPCPVPCPTYCSQPQPSVVTPVCLPGCGTANMSPCEEPCVPFRSHMTTSLPVIRRTTPRYAMGICCGDNTPLPYPRVNNPYLTAPFPASATDCEVELIRRPITCRPLLRTTGPPELIINIANTMPMFHFTTFAPLLANTARMPLLASAPLGSAPFYPGVQAPTINKCVQPMDIGIAMDTSAATVANWPYYQQFCRNLVDKFQMGNIARIGLITFDTIAKVPVNLDTYREPTALKLHCNRLVPDPYGRRRTDAALDIARERLFATARPGVPKMLFLLEHGRINGGDPSINWNQQLIEPSQRLKQMGVNVFAVGATPIAGVDELKTITSTIDDQSHVLPLQGYWQLPGVVPQIAAKACRLAASNSQAYTRDLGFTNGQPRDQINSDKKNEEARRKVSQLGPYGCSVNYVKIGCYNDDQNNPRPLPEPLLNDRSEKYPGFSGKTIDWAHWNHYMPEFVCRCAEKAKANGYKIFGVQFFASCWSGPSAQETYMGDGEGESDMCITTDYKKCGATDQVCVGKQETNFVYSLETEAKRDSIPKWHT